MLPTRAASVHGMINKPAGATSFCNSVWPPPQLVRGLRRHGAQRA